MNVSLSPVRAYWRYRQILLAWAAEAKGEETKGKRLTFHAWQLLQTCRACRGTSFNLLFQTFARHLCHFVYQLCHYSCNVSLFLFYCNPIIVFSVIHSVAENHQITLSGQEVHHQSLNLHLRLSLKNRLHKFLSHIICTHNIRFLSVLVKASSASSTKGDPV